MPKEVGPEDTEEKALRELIKNLASGDQNSLAEDGSADDYKQAMIKSSRERENAN